MNNPEKNIGLNIKDTETHARGKELGRNALDALPWWALLENPRFGQILKHVVDNGLDAHHLSNFISMDDPNDSNLASFCRLAPPAIEHIRRYDFAGKHIQSVSQSNSSKSKVVEVGTCCGEGAKRVSNICEKEIDIVGVDMNPIYLDEGRRRGNDRFVTFVQGDALELPFNEGTIDVAVSFETIEHTPDPERAVREISRVLKHGGIAIFSAPNNLCLPGIARGVVNESIETSHFMEPTPNEFKGWMERSFERSELFGQSFIPNACLPLQGLRGVTITAANHLGTDIDGFLTVIRRSVRLNGVTTSEIKPLGSGIVDGQPITLVSVCKK